MSRWEEVDLGNIASVDRNLVAPEDLLSEDKYIGLENIERGGGLANVESVVNAQISSAKARFHDGHVLFGRLRPYLAKIARPDFGGVCSTDILTITPGEFLDRDYLVHFLVRPEIVDLAASRTAGANLPRLSSQALMKFKVPLPPLDEQRRIATVLDKVDALRARRRQAIDLLDELVQSAFISMFDDPRGNPMGWEREPLGDLMEHGPQNGVYKPARNYGSGTPIVRIDAFYDGVVRDLGSLRRVDLDENEVERYGLSCGDVLINRVNSLEYLGKCALIPSLQEPTVFESNMMRFRLDGGRVDPRYVTQFLQTNFAKSQILSSAKNAVNQSSINQNDVRGLMVNVPPLGLQQEFVARVNVIEGLKEKNRAHLSHLDELFASIQQRAFRGDLWDEAA
ncbi:restriction endonuclease subunit S [Streptomonospora algeriensis]|uniref:Restriction endonuclease subunit S n=1 Tax=Streptomonospora algeriensis TaxID=995084 RepID=A0ABW3BEY9_9ACTN